MSEKPQDNLSAFLERVSAYLTQNAHRYVLVEHLLYVLLDAPRFQQLAQQCAADVEKMRITLEPVMANMETTTESVVPSSEYREVVARATELWRKAGGTGSFGADDSYVEWLVRSILKCDRDSHARYALVSAGMDESALDAALSKERHYTTVPFTTDMTEKAREGGYDPLIGRKSEMGRLIQILHKRRASNPLLLASSGVGKTALVEGLANRIAAGDVPDTLKDARLLSLDLAGMLAGAGHRGAFEERMKAVMEAVRADRNTILFIDEIHGIVGGSGDGSMDAASILKPALADGSIRVIGATTYEEHKNRLQKDRALARRFKKIDLAEPSREETVAILRGLRKRYEDFHGVRYSDAVLERIVELTMRYLKEQCCPGQAIEVMDELGSQRRGGLKSNRRLTVGDVDSLVAQMAGVPTVAVTPDDHEAIRIMPEELKKVIFGQDDVVDRVCRRLKTARAGLTSREKPLGVFALTGPTGVGKTELVKQVARLLGWAFHRFDMSEYSEKHSTARLIGSPPGYVGYDQPGALTECVTRTPNCVLLFDEIEKANPSIYNILLQVMDEGRLTDSSGRTARYNSTVIFMTSNIGSAEAEGAGNTIGFGGGESREEDILEESLKRGFPPEFRNRFTEIFRFRPADHQMLLRIVDKSIGRLNEMMADRGVRATLTAAAREHLASEAEKEKMGGRPVERLVDREVGEPLSDCLLFESLKNAEVLFDLVGGRIERREP